MRVSPVVVLVLAMVSVGLPSFSVAQAGRADVQEGNRLYREGRYDEAHEKYLDGLRAAPDSPVIRFNDANALYQSDDFGRAVDAYRGALEAADPALQAQAWYNLGNALYRQRQVEGAREAYKEALRRNPGDTDAKHNLEVALEQLQQQEQQQQRQQQQSDDSEDQDQQNQDRQQSGQDGQEQASESRQPPEQPPEENPEDQPGRDGQEERQSSGAQPEPETGEGDAQPQPGQMSREEAERLLQAITEDPGRIQRQRRSADPGRRTRRPW
ncbi:MAG: tetratricopeptide repeat protein [Acidobacteria bacterium]|nr:tetratricopeptide repeat protein [Acidobacteriota bacterium]